MNCIHSGRMARWFVLALRVMAAISPSACMLAQNSSTSLPTWQRTVTIQGSSYTLTFVGTDPANGSATTTITVPIVPLVVTTHSTVTPGKVYVNDATKRINGAPAGSSLSAALATLTSPLFQNATYATGGVNVGTTQYGDAILRAEFWDSVSTVASNYHVLLSPKLMPSLQIDVPMADGYPGAFASDPTAPIFAVVKTSYVYQAITAALQNFGPQEFVLFLGYNVTNCDDSFMNCEQGFHTALEGQTYAFGSYFDYNSTGGNQGDVSIISHETSEVVERSLFKQCCAPVGVSF